MHIFVAYSFGYYMNLQWKYFITTEPSRGVFIFTKIKHEECRVEFI